MRTTWVGLVTSDTWWDNSLSCSLGSVNTTTIPSSFSFSSQFLRNLHKISDNVPKQEKKTTKTSRCFSKPLCFLYPQRSLSCRFIYTSLIFMAAPLWSPMSSPRLLQSFLQLGRSSFDHWSHQAWIEHCSRSAENFFRLRSGHRKLIFFLQKKPFSSSSTLFFCEFYRCRGFQEALWYFPSCLIYENKKHPIIFCRLATRLDAPTEIRSRRKEWLGEWGNQTASPTSDRSSSGKTNLFWSLTLCAFPVIFNKASIFIGKHTLDGEMCGWVDLSVLF